MSRIIKSDRVNVLSDKIITYEDEYLQETCYVTDDNGQKKENKEDKIPPLIKVQIEQIKKDINFLTSEKENLTKEIQQLKETSIKESENIIKEAKNEKNNIINNAQDEAANIYEDYKNRGYNDGYEIGISESRSSYEGHIQEALDIKNSIIEHKEKTVSLLEEDIINLVLESIEKIIKIKLDKDDEIVINVLKEGLEKFTFTESLVIRVSDEDFEIINSSKQKILCLVENISDLEIKVDNSLNKGDLIIDTSSGSINPSINNQIDILKNEFFNLLLNEDK